MRIVRGTAAVLPNDTLRMPALQLDSLLGRARDEEEPVFPLVRRRDPPLLATVAPRPSLASSTVSIVLSVALVAGTLLLWALR
jgi:hypothetical protein